MVGAKRELKKYCLLAAILLFLLVVADSAFAAAAGVEAGLKTAAWQAVNLAILFAVFYKFAKRPVREYLERRQRAIAASIMEANRAKEEAEALFRNYEERLARISQETEEIYRKLSAEGVTEKDRIIGEAREGMERIRIEARFLGEQEVRKAAASLRQEAADLAVKLAQERIVANFNDLDQQRLVLDFLERVRQIS